LVVAVRSIVTRRGPVQVRNGDIREVRQKNLQPIDVVGFRTGFRKEAGSELTERHIRLELVRKSPSECEFLLILFVNSEGLAFVSGTGRFRVPLAIKPD
jgi:hypothetical protein